ncbi:MAG: hypothetical protein M3Q06_06960 [Bacteroidota bacterium]|nr:hypothetical protein [Bacteroidota bacterium]
MNRQVTLFFVFICLVACNGKAEKAEPESPATLPPQYYYFPKANVYVDSANRAYLFLANDGKTWQSAKQIPAAMQALMDKSVLIQNPAQPVWENNENHRLVYSALLYATASDTTKKEAPKSKIVSSKSEEDSVKEAAKDRKGLRKFFDKIFGKNKKDKDKGEKNDEEQ